MSSSDLFVIDVVDASRFELMLDGERVGLADYAIDDGIITIPHVETDPAHRGKGFAAELMGGVVASVRENGQRIRPLCPYAASYIDDRPDTHDLVVR